MSDVFAKRVTMWELFYDLIFVFAISKITHMIHHLHQGMVNWVDYLLFLSVCIMLMQAWMYQTTYVNKFGRERLTDKIGLWINMIGAIYVAVSINTDWSSTFLPFNIGMLLMQLAILFQFWFARGDYPKTSQERKEISSFMLMISFTSFLVFIGLLLGYKLGIWLMTFAYFFQAYAPWFVKERFLGATLNFPHLLERCGLITIILFGESIVGLTSIVTASSNPLLPLLIFFGLIFMFATYQIQTEEVIDHGVASNGMFLMHLHLLLPIGLLTVTAGFGYLLEQVNTSFLALFLLLGLAIFYLSLFATSRYNKPSLALTSKDTLYYFLVLLIGGGVLLVLKDYPLGLSAGFMLINLAMMLRNSLKLKKIK
ncbi:low temperature requirement protein A [Streptococcus oricebi]|nr:low temperature requirement protein A [Streptococcus oricebi]